MELSPQLWKLNNFHLFALVLIQLLPLAQLQHFTSYPQPRQLYYEAPPPAAAAAAAPATRLRRWEYVAAPAYVAPAYVAAPAAHYQQHPPNFQLINYRPSYQPLAVEYVQQQPPAPAPGLPAIYPQPSVQYQQRSIAPPHAELAKYRFEGNYIPIQQREAVSPQRRVEEQLFNVPPALFTSDVLHVVPSRTGAGQQQQQQQLQHQQQQLHHQQHPQQLHAERPRRYAAKEPSALDAVAAESQHKEKRKEKLAKEQKYFHDIFMRFDGPHGRSSGHVLEHPKQQERRFETQRGTNRYKGEVIWTDRRGGHGEHRWDMAQGKL